METPADGLCLGYQYYSRILRSRQAKRNFFFRRQIGILRRLCAEKLFEVYLASGSGMGGASYVSLAIAAPERVKGAATASM